MTRQLTLQRRGRGRPSEADERRYNDQVRQWRAGIVEIKSTLDFNVSARGWCDTLEEHELEKGDFDVAELEAIRANWPPIIEQWLQARLIVIEHGGDLSSPDDLSIPSFLNRPQTLFLATDARRSPDLSGMMRSECDE
jgi:hypothetical protein